MESVEVALFGLCKLTNQLDRRKSPKERGVGKDKEGKRDRQTETYKSIKSEAKSNTNMSNKKEKVAK